jgi:dolichol-phosphate mannosyltransferase
LAIDSLTAFSYLPVLLMFSMGLLLTLLSGVLWKVPPAGGGASRDACFFLGTGLSFLGLGVLAEYLWRILEASRGFPDFVVEWEVGFKGERGVRKNVRKIP